MSIHVDHIVVTARDKVETMNWISRVLGVDPGPVTDPFAVVELGDTSIDYLEVEGDELRPLHIALRVDESEFDGVLARLIEAGAEYFARPQNADNPGKGHVYYSNGGRGFYFYDPNGHPMEIKTARDSFDPEVEARSYTAPYVPVPRH